MQNKPVVIFDLDGTLLTANSFPLWVIYLLSGHFEGLNLAQRCELSLRTAHILAQRKLMHQPHAVTKRELQRLWAIALEKDDTRAALRMFSDKLKFHLRPALKTLLVAVQKKRIDAILATSAAGDYAEYFARQLGFEHILTTPRSHEPDSTENCREQKRDRVLSTVQVEGWIDRPRIFLTDHSEDLPLIKHCQRVLWFGSEQQLALVKAGASGVDIIPARYLPAEAIEKLIAR